MRDTAQTDLCTHLMLVLLIVAPYFYSTEQHRMKSILWPYMSSPRTRLLNARMRVDHMVAAARARVDRVLAKRSDGATNALADRLHVMVDDVNAQAKQAGSDAADLNITIRDRTLVNAANQSAITSRKAEAVETVSDVH